MTNRIDIRIVNLYEYIKQISEINEVEEIYIFGSRAYCTGSLRSDIDILVYAPNGLRKDSINHIMESEESLDIFKTFDKVTATSFTNDSFLKRDDLISALDAKLLWSKENQFDSNIENYKEIKVLKNIDFKTSILPSYTKEESIFFENNGHDTVFVIMPFKEELNDLYKEIKDVFGKYKYKVVRADEKEYANGLWENVKVYLDCCKIAVAVFEKNDQDNYNPNVALEVGYMLAKGNKVCILKDLNLKKIPTDLISKLYKEYDPNNIKKTIRKQLKSWIEDNLLL